MTALFQCDTLTEYNNKVSQSDLGKETEFISKQRQKQPSEVFHKKGVLKNFPKFTGKHLCQSRLYNKVERHRCFPLNVATFLRTRFLQNISDRYFNWKLFLCTHKGGFDKFNKKRCFSIAF